MASDTKNITINGEVYTFQRALTGRGQPGMAGFYLKDGVSYLIKEDDAATCFAESLAIIHNPLRSKMNDPIIQAQVAQFDKDGTGTLVPISIQRAFIPAEGESFAPFDQVILGRKRDPKTLISEESSHDEEVQKTIGNLSIEVKTQLAEAIYISQLNGDESLHTGQFVTSQSKNTGAISKIQRIDFGALGRFGLSRTTFSPLETSEQYKSSGQYGKDYVSFLVKDDHVKKVLFELWSKTDPAVIVQQVQERFDTQLAGITDPTLKEKALSGLFDTLTKSCKPAPSKKTNLDELTTQVREILSQSTEARCLGMVAAANKLSPPLQDKTNYYKNQLHIIEQPGIEMKEINTSNRNSSEDKENSRPKI
jgi:hypothetical protein